ncbi:MAG: AtpZ/AtpI family protein [Rickettsiales bacterium]|jgi:predicted F0F1-ATPase subunit|nr:AtpZ/AtpI family protein [Rickettsiales bacterium]
MQRKGSIRHRRNARSDSELKRLVCRKIESRARRKDPGEEAVWYAFSFLGLVGWNIVVPTALLTWLGVTLDRKYGLSEVRLAPLFIMLGLAVGAYNSCRWISGENRKIGRGRR